jgi:thymidine kinase
MVSARGAGKGTRVILSTTNHTRPKDTVDRVLASPSERVRRRRVSSRAARRVTARTIARDR